MLDKTIIGVDLGGTKIHSGLVIGNKVDKDYRLPTPNSKNKDDILDALKESIRKVFTSDVEGIGIGAPGVIDFETGTLISVDNIKALEGVSIKNVLEQEFNVPVHVNNDANCFILGEKHFGSGMGYDDVLGLTLGTGLGGGLIINGKLYAGRNGGAGEFCGIKYKDKDLESYCSSQFFKNVHNTTGLEQFNLAKQGDKKALAMFNELGTNIGEAIYMLLLSFDPQVIVIGGSIAGAKEFLVEPISNLLKTFPNQHIVDTLKIEFSSEPNSAVLGAAALNYN